MAVFPICGTVALGIGIRSGVNIDFVLILILAMIGWFIITAYSGYRFINFVIAQAAKPKETEDREKYFSALESAYDIRDRLRLLEKDAKRNIERIHSMGKDGRFYGDRTNKSGTV
jgi:hypothetical protein